MRRHHPPPSDYSATDVPWQECVCVLIIGRCRCTSPCEQLTYLMVRAGQCRMFINDCSTLTTQTHFTARAAVGC
ncbi:hypothetical protein DXC54_05780 [Bifidobacterium longum]|uniref:Uncharacterized protein n=1 Tax=Bifidobacterium longum TaxID=216816 RepID=A0A3E4S7W6_BIFLN|nr:hypothetical protein DXC63_03215 [Bifidobacterium longum]RGL65631.1 hypothetical protein DXC54_05780 [Bifidobacterium longum]RGM10214.1 hypothetical protein DXC32_07995 [Bifidobacterium longum]